MIRKSVICFTLLFFLLFAFIACKSDSDTSAERTPQILSGVWDVGDRLPLPDGCVVQNHHSFSRSDNGEIYFTAAPTSMSFARCLMTFSDGAVTAVSYPDGGFSDTEPYTTAVQTCFTALPDGGFASVYDIGKSHMLVITDADNRILAQTDIPGFGDLDQIHDMIYAPKQNTIYFCSETRAAAYTPDGTFLYDLAMSYPILGLGVARDGTGYLCAYDLLTDITKISVRPFDNAAKKTGEPYLLPDTVNLSNADLYDHPVYDLCWSTGDAVWGCDFLPAGTDTESVTPAEIINLLNSGIDAMTPTDLIFLSEDAALMYSSDYRDNYLESEPYYALLSRVPEDELKPVFEIVIASCGAGTLAEDALAFNASQDEFRVVFRSYDRYGTDDAEKPRAALETDLITGNIPDIILGNGFFVLDDYVHLGIFADMYTYLDSDPTFGRDDLHACVLTPFEADDSTLPYLVDTFSVSTVEATAASADRIPDDWTFADAEALSETMSPDGMLFYVRGESGMALLEKLLPVTVTGLFENGKTDRDALAALLSFCRDYPTSDTLSSDDRKAMLKSGQILTTLQTHLLNPYFYLDSRYEIGGGIPPVYVGFPSADGNGAAISMRRGFAITKAAAEHETASRGAWAFIRYVIENQTYDDQGARGSYFGASKASLDRMFDSAEHLYCIHCDEARGTLSYYGQYGHTHNENEPEPNVISFDDDDRMAIRDLLSGITVRADALPVVCEIIYEEASAYFANAKTLDETITVIASRAEIYFAEKQ